MIRRYSNYNMLVWLLWLSVLFSVIALSEHASNLPYRTLVEKVVAGFNTKGSTTFAIPDGQCSGFIDESLLCGADGVAGAVRVEASERMSFPSVRIDPQLRNATVTRQQDARGRCAGAALVDLRVGCLVSAPRPAHPARPPRRARRALRHLPPSPARSTG